MMKNFGLKEVTDEYIRRAVNPYQYTLSPHQQKIYDQWTTFFYYPTFFEPQTIIAKAKLLPSELSYLAPVILELLKRRPLHYYTHVPYKEVGYYATGWPLEFLGIDEDDLEQMVECINKLDPPFYVLAAIAPVGKDKVRPCGILVQIRMDKILDYYSPTFI